MSEGLVPARFRARDFPEEADSFDAWWRQLPASTRQRYSLDDSQLHDGAQRVVFRHHTKTGVVHGVCLYKDVLAREQGTWFAVIHPPSCQTTGIRQVVADKIGVDARRFWDEALVWFAGIQKWVKLTSAPYKKFMKEHPAPAPLALPLSAALGGYAGNAATQPPEADATQSAAGLTGAELGHGHRSADAAPAAAAAAAAEAAAQPVLAAAAALSDAKVVQKASRRGGGARGATAAMQAEGPLASSGLRRSARTAVAASSATAAAAASATPALAAMEMRGSGRSQKAKGRAGVTAAAAAAAAAVDEAVPQPTARTASARLGRTQARDAAAAAGAARQETAALATAKRRTGRSRTATAAAAAAQPASSAPAGGHLRVGDSLGQPEDASAARGVFGLECDMIAVAQQQLDLVIRQVKNAQVCGTMTADAKLTAARMQAALDVASSMLQLSIRHAGISPSLEVGEAAGASAQADAAAEGAWLQETNSNDLPFPNLAPPPAASPLLHPSEPACGQDSPLTVAFLESLLLPGAAEARALAQEGDAGDALLVEPEAGVDNHEQLEHPHGILGHDNPFSPFLHDVFSNADAAVVQGINIFGDDGAAVPPGPVEADIDQH